MVIVNTGTTNGSTSTSTSTNNNTMSNSSNMNRNDDMEIDPIDDGPILITSSSGNSGGNHPHHHHHHSMIPSSSSSSSPITMTVVPSSSLSNQNINYYMDQLRSDDVTIRIHAITHYLPNIIVALGCERTRTELIPFLIDGIDDEDEVLLAIATALGRMSKHIISYLGGYTYLSKSLWRYMELLLSIEDTNVRAAAIQTTQSILEQIIGTSDIDHNYAVVDETTTTTTTILSDEQSQQINNSNNNAAAAAVAFVEYADMIRRLANKEWFTARISAAILIASPPFFTYCRHSNSNSNDSNSDVKHTHTQFELATQLISIFVSLCRDDTSMVRRIAAQQLGNMVSNIVSVFGRQLALQQQQQSSSSAAALVGTTTTSMSMWEEGNIILRIIVPLYEEIASAEQPDAVRLQTTENCVAFGRVLSDMIVINNKHNSNNNHASRTTGTPSHPPQQPTTTSTTGRVIQQLHPDEIQLLHKIVPLIVATVDDRSWRVRWTAAAKFAQVIMAYDALSLSSSSSSSSSSLTDPANNNNNNNEGNHHNTSFILDTLIPAYEKLLQDPEAEVRTAATFNLALVAQCQSRVPLVSATSPPTPLLLSSTTTNNNNNNNSASSSGGGGVHHLAVASMAGISHTLQPRVSVAERLVKRITSLTEDESEHVRAALAMVATELAPVLGKDATITYLVPPVLLLLRDAASEVRLNLMSSLSSLNSVIGVDLLSQSLLPAILDLAQDGKWRIRLAMIQHIPLLAEQLGREFFTERLTPLCVGWLGDDIASIRHAAASNLKELTTLFGTEWAVENLLPPIEEIREHESYLRRLTALQACSMMATAMDADTARQQLLPIILDMATDVVPNIRFNVAKELRDIAIVCGTNSYEPLILPILNMLSEDDDRDVRFYADISINALDEEFATITK